MPGDATKLDLTNNNVSTTRSHGGLNNDESQMRGDKGVAGAPTAGGETTNLDEKSVVPY